MSHSLVRVPRMLPGLLLAGLFGALASCAGPGSGPASSAAGKEKGEDEDDDDEAVTAHELEIAKLEVDLARMEAEQELASAEPALAAARLAADKAQLEREAFASGGRARGLDEARLALDQSRGRAEDAAAELAELESMYAAEEFATKTKELVITRSRRDLEHAKRALALAERKLKELEDFELPSKERELEEARVEAGKGLLEAEQALTKLRLEKQIAVAKAEKELEKLTRKAEKQKAKKASKP